MMWVGQSKDHLDVQSKNENSVRGIVMQRVSVIIKNIYSGKMNRQLVNMLHLIKKNSLASDYYHR